MTRPFFVSVLSAFAISAFAIHAFAVPAELIPKDGSIVPTHTALQKSYLNLPRPERIAKFANEDFRKTLSRDKWYPLPTELSWKSGGECEVSVFRKADGKLVFSEKTSRGSVKVDNLEIGCDYIWKVKDADGEAASSFRTEDEAPRLIRVEHIPNVRDLGGRIGLGGKRIRQNLVFRSAGLNENATTKPCDKDEVAKADPTGAILSAMDKVADYREGLEIFRKNRSGLVFPKCKYPQCWKYADVAQTLDERDAVFLVVCGSLPDGRNPVAVDDKGIADFGALAKSPAKWIALEGEIVADGDGFASFGASGDWFWSIEVNGNVIRNRLSGNHGTADSASVKMLVPVNKGTNKVRVLLGAGSGGFLFCLRESPVENREGLLENELAELKKLPDSFAGKSKKLVPGRTRIHDDNRGYLLDTLGIRSDIDLRSDEECFGMTGSPLGPAVKWYHYSSAAYGAMQKNYGRENFTKVFKVFLDESNYPIDFHCIAGQDRTGAVAFILNGLLGVDEDQLYLDWEVTGFWNRNPNFCHEKLFDRLVAGFNESFPEGTTLNDRIELYVKSLGFTDADIAKFRSIMLENTVVPLGQ